MVRLIIVFIGLFLVWVLFFSGFTKDRKILVSAVVALLAVIGIWVESYIEKPSLHIVENNELISCGIEAKHSYRSNYDFILCLHNKANEGHIKRLVFDLVAQQCDVDHQCTELERVQRDLSVDIAPSSTTKLMQNLNFSNVYDAVENNIDHVVWTFEAQIIRASK